MLSFTRRYRAHHEQVVESLELMRVSAIGHIILPDVSRDLLPYSWALHRSHHSLGHRRVFRPSSRGRDLLGFSIFGDHRNRGLGHRGGGHPCEESSLDVEEREIGHFGAVVYDRGDECRSVRRIDLQTVGHGLYRSAMMPTEGYEPTASMSDYPIKACFPPYLDLEQIISADTLVMHLVVSIICITAALILDECEASKKVSRGVVRDDCEAD